MLELRLLVDKIDYPQLLDTLEPLLAEHMEGKGGIWELLGKNSGTLSGLAKTLLRNLPPEKREALLVQLVDEKKDRLLEKANEKASEMGAGLHLQDFTLRQL